MTLFSFTFNTRNKCAFAVIIHLKRRCDRKEAMDKLFDELGIQFEYLATTRTADGRELAEEELTYVQGYTKNGDSIESTDLLDKRGKLAAQLSHYRAVCYLLYKIDNQEIKLSEDKPFVAVFEDDLNIPPSENYVEITSENLPKDTGALMLAASMSMLKHGYHPVKPKDAKDVKYLIPSTCYCNMAVLYTAKYLRVLKTAYEANLYAAKVTNHLQELPGLDTKEKEVISDASAVGMCACDVVTALLQKWFLNLLTEKEQHDYKHIFVRVEKVHAKFSERIYMVNPLLINSLHSPSDIFFDSKGKPLVPLYNEVLKAGIKQTPVTIEQLPPVLSMTRKIRESFSSHTSQSSTDVKETKKKLLNIHNDFNEGRINYDKLISGLEDILSVCNTSYDYV